MLKPQPSPLSLDQQQALLLLLSSDALLTLRRVVEAKAMRLEVESAIELASANPENRYKEKAEQTALESVKYRTFLAVLDEVSKEKNHHLLTITIT